MTRNERTPVERYFIRINGQREVEFFSERMRFDAYAVQEDRLAKGAILDLEAFNLTDYGWMRTPVEVPVTILTNGEPDDYADR